MALNEDILEELKTLNGKMDQLIAAVNRGNITNGMPRVPQMPQVPGANMSNMPDLMQNMGASMNMPQAHNAEDIKRTVEDRIKKAREEANAKMAKMKAERTEG